MSYNLDTTERKTPVPFYCDRNLSEIRTIDSAMMRSFPAVNLTSPHKNQLFIRGYYDFQGGYARHTREVTFRIVNRYSGFNVRIEPLPTPTDIEPIVWQRVNSLTKTPNFKFNQAIHLTISGPGYAQKEFQQQDRFARLAKKRIIWTMVETHPDTTRKDIGEWLKNMDEVWAPTTTDIARFRSVGVDSRIMPIGVDLKKYNPSIESLDIVQTRNKFVFGVFGTWNKRKGIMETIRAFCKAFDKKDDVVLFLFCKYGTRPFDEEGWEDNRKKSEEDKWNIQYEFNRYTKDFDKENMPHIVLFDVPIQECLMPHMMKVADTVVGFSAGESTWLPGLESFALGIPVIQLQAETNGFMDYLNDENSLLCKDVKYVEADKEFYEGTSEYYEGCKLAQGNEDELADMMVYAYKNRKELKKQTLDNRDKVLLNRDWSHVVGCVTGRLARIR